jgi:hypothetical protein
MNGHSISFSTDTATMCIFDLAALKHRLSDDADWWSIPRAELEEVNLGNVAFLGLGEDGSYSVTIVDHVDGPTISTNINVPSGQIFLGAAEEVTGDELEPEALRGGAFLRIPTGIYNIRAKRDENKISISFSITTNMGNEHTELLRLR